MREMLLRLTGKLASAGSAADLGLADAHSHRCAGVLYQAADLPCFEEAVLP